MEMVQLYEFSSPNETIDSQYGFITVKKWLKLEKKRIEKDPTRKAEIKTEAGKVALFVDLPEGCDE